MFISMHAYIIHIILELCSTKFLKLVKLDNAVGPSKVNSNQFASSVWLMVIMHILGMLI